MRQPVPIDFYGVTTADLVVGSATPPAKITLLQQADLWPVAVAVGPYASCGYVMENGTTGTPTTRYFADSVPPCCKRLRYDVTIAASDTTGTAADIEASTTTGGDIGNDIATIKLITPYTRTFKGSATKLLQSLTSGEWDDTAPAAKIDRMLELAAAWAPSIEPITVRNCCAVSAWVAVQFSDLEP